MILYLLIAIIVIYALTYDHESASVENFHNTRLYRYPRRYRYGYPYYYYIDYYGYPYHTNCMETIDGDIRCYNPVVTRPWYYWW